MASAVKATQAANPLTIDETTLTLSTLASHFSDEDAAYQLMESTHLL